MDNISWITLASGVGAASLSWLTLIGMSWKTIRKAQKAVAVEAVTELGLLSRSEYEKDQDAVREEFREEIRQIRQMHQEFGVLKNDMEHVKASNLRIENKVDSLSGEITGAIARVAEMKGRLHQ